MNTVCGLLPDPARKPLILLTLVALTAVSSGSAQESQAPKEPPGTPEPPARSAAPDATGAAPARRVLLVRASPAPLGDNSVLSVRPDEARKELQGLESGLFRGGLSEPRVLSVPEQGGWVRGLLKEPKASRLWSFFNPRAPRDGETDLMRSARIFGVRGDAPLPISQTDPIQVEPVGIRFWQIGR